MITFWIFWFFRFFQRRFNKILPIRSSYRMCFIKKGALRNFTKFTGKQHLFLQNTSRRPLLTSRYFPFRFVSQKMKPKIEFVRHTNFESIRELDFTQREKTYAAIIIENVSLHNIYFHFEDPKQELKLISSFLLQTLLKFWNDSKANKQILKAVFHKIYLVHSWILCPIYKPGSSYFRINFFSRVSRDLTSYLFLNIYFWTLE